MARRATYLFDVYKADSPSLRISGGWEFMRPSGNKPEPQVANALAKAFNLMKYDIGLLAQAEADATAGLDVSFESYRKTSKDVPVTTWQTTNGDSIGIIRFPALRPGQDLPSRDTVRRIGKMVKKLRETTRLVIGLSDWGWVGEREFLAQQGNFPPDLLLGSGSGPGLDGRFEVQEKCVWVRPYDKGRTISEIILLAWPDRSPSFAWTESGNIKTLSIPLGDRYSDNRDVSAILH